MSEEPTQDTPAQAVCVTITIVGAVRNVDGKFGKQLQAFQAAVGGLLQAHFPEFLPAHPAVVVNAYDVRDDWIKR